MECARELEVHADSAFSKEDDRGYAIKGINISGKGYDRASGEVRRHLLESAAQSHKNVVRLTFGAIIRGYRCSRSVDPIVGDI